MNVAVSEMSSVKSSEDDRLPVVVVGTGPVGMHVAQSFMRHDPSIPIIIYGNEPWEPYNRVRLSMLLSGEAKFEDIQYKLDIPDTSPLIQHQNCAIVKIDRDTNTVIDELGRIQSYSKLILAVGSSPHIPNFKGNDLRGVYTFRNMNDALHLQARTTRTRKVVVIGGGLLGIEAARAMQRLNTEVTVIEHSSRLMGRQLDDEAAAMLREYLMSLGIQILFQDGVKEISGTHSVEQVILRKGTKIDCDTVIVATGIKPNISIALESGISVARGIRVNDQMMTSDPDIYAVGECAEHREKIYGLVAPGLEQAKVATHSIMLGKSHYKGSIAATNLKVIDKPIFSMGRVGEEEFSLDLDEYVYRDSDRNIYRKIIVKRGRLVGALAIGSWQEQGRIQEGIHKELRIWPWQLLRFKQQGYLWPEQDSQSIANWPNGASVCNCTGVTRGQLTKAILQGHNTVDKLIACTGASSVCGSCRPLLQELTGSTEPPEKTRGASVLVMSSVLFIITLIATVLFGPIPYTETAKADIAWDALWRNNTIKQISGYSILGLSLLALTISLRKRIKKICIGDFSLWRIFHVTVSILVIAALVTHTGFRLGNNLNQYLMISFMALIAIGSFSALMIAMSHKVDAVVGKQLRDSLVWGHILFFWPVPVLLAYHIFSSYYF